MAQSEATQSETTTSQSTSEQGARILIDAGPIGAWIIVYNVARNFAPDQALYLGTGVYMVAAIIALFFSIRLEKRVPPMLVMTTVIVLGFGAIGILLQDPIFIYAKPTIINLFLSFLILVSMAFGFNVWKLFFKHVFELPEHVWTIYAVRWALWFQFLAFLNEFMWRHITDTTVPESARWFETIELTESFWANSKLWVMGLSMGFMLLQLPLLFKYQKFDEEAEDSAKS
ncbi:MAG: septation protein A [Alphaproteobacteria bacterium]|nr:septation protein A [Alphaproteobacteria bacterium]